MHTQTHRSKVCIIYLRTVLGKCAPAPIDSNTDRVQAVDGRATFIAEVINNQPTNGAWVDSMRTDTCGYEIVGRNRNISFSV